MSRDIDELIDSPYSDEVMGEDKKPSKMDQVMTVANSPLVTSLLNKIPGAGGGQPTPTPTPAGGKPQPKAGGAKEDEAMKTGAIVGSIGAVVLGFLAWKFTGKKHRTMYTVLGVGVGAGAGVVAYMAKKG